jgi:Transglycosylase SLT domain
MRQILVCAAFILFAPVTTASSLTWPPVEDDPAPVALAPVKTTFAYAARHGAVALPAPTLGAMWFNGEDRELPQAAVAEPIMVLPARAVRPQPSRDALCSQAAIVAAGHDLPAPFFANLIHQESGFKSHVISPAGAQGIAQFMPRTARAYGLDNPFEPLHAMSVSAKFLRELLAQFGNLGLAAAAYNAGPTRVQNWMARRGNLPEETRNYVRNITGHPAERWARVNAKTEETALPGHARCPGMPEIAVSIPEAAPVKVAKKGKSKVAAKKTAPDAKADVKPDAKTDTKTADTKMADAKAAPAAASGKPYTLASMTGGKKTAVISNGKLKIMAPEKGAKPSAGKKAAAGKAKPAAKPATKTAAKSEPKAKSKPAPKTAAKPATKTAAKPAATKSGGKGVKVAAAR